MPKKLGWLAVPHFLMHEELANALVPGGGQPSHQLGLQCCVLVPFWWRGGNILHLRSVPVIQLRNDVAVLCSLAGNGPRLERTIRPEAWARTAEVRRSPGKWLLPEGCLQVPSSFVGVTNVVVCIAVSFTPL
jgi:hypothetical protein